MKNTTSPKAGSILMLTAIIAFALTFSAQASSSADVKGKTSTAKSQSVKEGKPARDQFATDYWARLSRQFAWNTAGRMVPASSGDAGC